MNPKKFQRVQILNGQCKSPALPVYHFLLSLSKKRKKRKTMVPQSINHTALVEWGYRQHHM
jgi:hypothetical protein